MGLQQLILNKGGHGQVIISPPGTTTSTTSTSSTSTTTSVPTSWTGKKVRFLGDSFTFGTYLGSSAQRWTSVLTGLKGGTEENYGASGTVIETGLCRGLISSADIPNYDSSYAAIFLAEGLNDVGVNNASSTVANYQTAMEAFLDLIITTHGWPANKVYVVNPYWIPQAGRDAYIGECGSVSARVESSHTLFAAAAITAASNKGAHSIDIYTYIKNDPSKLSYIYVDNVHYIAAGHTVVANYINSVI